MGVKSESMKHIDNNYELVCDVSKKVWEFAELSLMEYKSMELFCKVLEECGFKVEKGICGVQTAFSGSFGSGKPVIGILAEYDALSGLSQVGGEIVKKELVKGGNGHGCGHSMLGAGSLAAVLGIKKYLENSQKSGTVIFYGCPGEEGGAGKAFMAREGLWSKLDAALTWHPSDSNEVTSGSSTSSIQVEYRYKGVASHAAGCPELGRSALDAVELLNIGVQFLREHMPKTASIHYAMIDGGGVSPNVVQPTASVLYMIRDTTVKNNLKLVDRVDNIAKAAAIMTDTSMEKVFIDGTADTVPNNELEKLLYENFKNIGAPEYDKNEIEFAAKLKKTYDYITDELPGSATNLNLEVKNQVEKIYNSGNKVLNEFIIPHFPNDYRSPGSTDVGDVSWLTPTAQIRVVCYPHNSPGHSWQNVSCGTTSIADKGLIVAGKVIAATAIDIYEDPSLLEKVKEEFIERTKEGYTCPIPEGVDPIVPGN